MPAGSVRLKLLNTSVLPRHKPLVVTALPASLSARPFSITPGMSRAVRPVFEDGRTSNTDIHICIYNYISLGGGGGGGGILQEEC